MSLVLIGSKGGKAAVMVCVCETVLEFTLARFSGFPDWPKQDILIWFEMPTIQNYIFHLLFIPLFFHRKPEFQPNFRSSQKNPQTANHRRDLKTKKPTVYNSKKSRFLSSDKLMNREKINVSIDSIGGCWLNKKKERNHHVCTHQTMRLVRYKSMKPIAHQHKSNQL